MVPLFMLRSRINRATPSGCKILQLRKLLGSLNRFSAPLLPNTQVLLHAGNNLGAWSAKHIHQVILESFQLTEKAYGLNQLRYDLRKLKGHDLLQRDGSRYAYRLTSKGILVALLFLFFHKRLCGPLANSRFHHQPEPIHPPESKLEAAYHKADAAIQDIVNLLAAAATETLGKRTPALAGSFFDWCAERFILDSSE